MLAMIALFPTRHFGVELGAILLIFTGAVWNMAFSFYSSLKSIPRELREAADIYRFSRLQRLVQLELPYAAIGLVWNSIMSVAGAWFTLMACEMFHFGTSDFRLPGLGSYLQTAADKRRRQRHRLGPGHHDRASSSPSTSSSGGRSSPGATSSSSSRWRAPTAQLAACCICLRTPTRWRHCVGTRPSRLNESLYIALGATAGRSVSRSWPSIRRSREISPGASSCWLLVAACGVCVLSRHSARCCWCGR